MVFKAHDNDEGYRIAKQDLPPPRDASQPRKLRFPAGEELMDRITEDDPAAVEKLLASGADPNYRDGDNMTPLHK